MRKLSAALLVVIAIVALLSAGSLATARSGTPTVAASAGVDTAASTWRILLIIFRETDTDYVGTDGRWHHMTTSLSQSTIDSMLTALDGINQDVRDWSAGAVQWDVDVRYAPRPITHMSTPDSNHQQWVDPASIQDVIDGFSPNGVYDQIMVYWEDDDGSANIPTMGWGLSMGWDPWGYCTAFPFDSFDGSQVWVHEWLHSACWFYEAQGYPMPSRGSDSGGALGYTDNGGGMVGWGAFYSDLMQGKVVENGRYVGITREAWLSGSPRTPKGLPPSPPTSYTGWKGEYFSNTGLSGTPTAYRDDQDISFDWGRGKPIAGVSVDNFSVRWTRTIDFAAGLYRFCTLTDDGVRLYIDGALIIDEWVDQDHVQNTAERSLTAGSHTVVMEYYERGNDAAARLWWEKLGSATTTTTEPPTTTTTTIQPTTTTTSTSTTSTTKPPVQFFTDIAASPYKTAIESLAQADIIGGYSDGTFRPENPVLRAQFAKMIAGSLELPVTEDMSSPFTDLGEDDPRSLYPHEYVAAAAAAGITRGVTVTTFSPYTGITRAQVVTMVVRALQTLRQGTLLEPSPGWQGVFPADDPTHGANIGLAEYNGLLNAFGSASAWSLGEQATRGEVAQVLYAMDQLSSPSSAAGSHPFVLWEDGALRLLRADGSRSHLLDLPRSSPVAWSADGREVYYQGNRITVDEFEETWDLMALDVSTGATRTIVTSAQVCAFADRSNAYFRGVVNPGTGEIYLGVDNMTIGSAGLISVSPTGAEMHRRSGSDAGLAVSSSGTWLGCYEALWFSGSRFNTLTLASAAAGPGAEQYLDPPPTDPRDTDYRLLGWWDDGTLLAYRGRELAAFSAPTWTPTLGPRGYPSGATWFARTADGSALAYLQVEEQGEPYMPADVVSLWLAERDGSHARRVAVLPETTTWAWCQATRAETLP